MKFQSTLLVVALATSGVTSSGQDLHQKPRVLKGTKSADTGKVGEVVAVSKSSKAVAEAKTSKDTAEGGKASKESSVTKGTKGPKSAKFGNFKAGKEGKSSKEAKSSKEPKGTKTPKAPEGVESAKEVRESFSAVPVTSKKTKSSKGATPDTAPGCPFEEIGASTKGTKRRALKGTKSETMPTTTKSAKGTTTKSAKGTTTCPSSSKASKSSKGAPAVPLDNAWGQAVGTQVVISPLANPTFCVQPKAVAAGAGLETVPCTYDAGDAFTIGEHGQLVSSDPGLCVTGAGSELVLDACETSCSAIFQYDVAAFTVQPVFVDTCLFWTTVGGDLFLLEEMAADAAARRLMVEDTQEFLVIPYVMGSESPSSSDAPSSSLAPI
eukprot:CAMPEP_0194279052 /NCGR_PEP_ID=MMETSP0169-20130528/13136_1 /TAXON_ID=218684 /ORGANISM="Corethron pennatum, Strain L29A3" /LENGTH=379 /DNA_ID=CAMNT_0039023405 /DNA_START=64 /DNA_END=1203 /DNA_ORIENTATION=-